MWDLLAITAGDSLFSHLNIIIMIFNLINDFTELKKRTKPNWNVLLSVLSTKRIISKYHQPSELRFMGICVGKCVESLKYSKPLIRGKKCYLLSPLRPWRQVIHGRSMKHSLNCWIMLRYIHLLFGYYTLTTKSKLTEIKSEKRIL